MKNLLDMIKKQKDHPDVKAYFNREDPRHEEVVNEVARLLSAAHGEDVNQNKGMFSQDESEIRQALYDDPASVSDQLRSIYFDKNSNWHRAYFNPNDPLHNEAVQRVNILTSAKFDDDPIKEVMPVITSTEANIAQSPED